ncbi:MAG: efflux RND transporter periplasmic adaptor subunit [Flavobacteriaceae bacterium]|nr:efflux RND transporter periplasmic adaptor subunit [Flavobacteriaceae bacterium]
MKKIIISVLTIATIGGTIYTLNKNKKDREEQTAIVAQKNSHISVRAEQVAFREMNTQYVANGTFQPKQEVLLSAETQGRVLRVLVDEGSYVRAGQTLAIIKGDKLNVNVNNAQAVYQNALAEVKRFESAYSTGGVTKQQLDQIKLQAETAKNNLQSAKLMASDVNVTASFPGIINKRNVEPGAFVAPGHGLFHIVNVSTLKLNVSVDEKNIGSLRQGQSVEITSSVYPEAKFTGTITFIAPKADAGLNFPVEIEIKNNANNDLKAGMYGTAHFGSRATSQVLTIPRAAFVGSVSSNQVYVVKDGKAVLKTIVSGRNFGDYIEVISGLANGEQVITSGQINLSDQAPVEIIK